jgi:hypothetical protein
MQFLILLFLSVATAVLRFHFGKVAVSPFGTYTAFAHIIVGMLLLAAFQWHRENDVKPLYPSFLHAVCAALAKLITNPYLLILLMITGIEAICFLV